MQTIPLDQLEKMFAAMRTEDISIDGEMQWSYYFNAAETATLEPLAKTLEELGYDLYDPIQSDEEPVFILQAQRVEKHTPDSLFKLNAALETLAGRFPGVEYDGMDVNSGEDEPETTEGEPHQCRCGHGAENGEAHECCGGHGAENGEAHECCGGHGAENGEAHECCGGHGAENSEAHECCGGHGAENGEAHECCGGHGGGGCCGKHHHEPITNPQILEAMERISNDHSEEAQQQITIALQNGLYLVPVLKQTGAESNGEAVQVLVCTDEQNDEYLPLFTDEAALKTWTDQPVAAMVLNAPEAWDFILKQPECAGAVINPASASLPLTREMVGILKKMFDEFQENGAK